MRGAFLGIWLFTALGAVSAGDLYVTDFENFTAGPDQWAGSDGWLGNTPGTGSHGISSGLVPGLGKTAYLGLNPPSTANVIVFRPLDHDPFVSGTATIEFETLMGIEDSRNGRYDNFYLSFFNIGGAYLGGLLFSNDPLTYGIWRLDGETLTETDLDFTHGELHLLLARVDPHANTWSVEFNGLELFTDAPFNATGDPPTLGAVGAEWQIPSGSPAQAGDNWLLIADWRITAVPPGAEPFVIDEVVVDPAGRPSLTWTGEPGWDYRVLRSEDMIDWSPDLPGSFFTGLPEAAPLQFTDPQPSTGGRGFYRIERTVTP